MFILNKIVKIIIFMMCFIKTIQSIDNDKIVNLNINDTNVIEEDNETNSNSINSNREKRFLPRFPYNTCWALAVAMAIPLETKKRNVYMSFNFETNYYLPYFDIVQGLVPIPYATITQPGVNAGTLAVQRTINGNSNIIIENNKNITVSTTDDTNSIENHDTKIVKSKNLKKIIKNQKGKKSKHKTHKIKKNNKEAAADVKKPEDKIISRKTRKIQSLLSRRKFYKILESKMESMGLNGRACLLKAICEAAEHPLGIYNGVLGDIFHIILTPSSTRDENLQTDIYEAEDNGLNQNCKQYELKCPKSFLDYISLKK